MPLPEGLDPTRIEGVFVDLDGTVVHHAELLPTAIEAVAALQATGVPVVVATGRMFISACRFADLLGLNQQHCVTIGDGENDLELIDWAGFGIAVGGGHPELLRRADWIAPSIDDDGVPRVLQAIAEARS